MRDRSQLKCETGSWDVAVDSIPHAAEPDGRVRVAMKASECPLSIHAKLNLLPIVFWRNL